MSLIQQSTLRNMLLRSLSAADFALLQPHLRQVQLALGETIYDAGVAIELIDFPETGTASIVINHEDGEMVEVGLYGFEGMSGASVLLGARQSPHTSMVQVSDMETIQIASERLVEAYRASSSLQDLLSRYIHTIMIQVASTATSNAKCEVPERLARWLLMCHDRAEGDHIHLTHEYMAAMLAVRRGSVTITLHALEATGAIRSTRGVLHVINRQRLEEFAGASYGKPEKEYSRLIGAFGKGQSELSLVL